MTHSQSRSTTVILLLLALITKTPEGHTEQPTNTPNHSALGQTLVFVNHGAMLKPRGLLALSTNTKTISIFSKIKIPQITPPAGCSPDWAKAANAQIIIETHNFLDLFKNIAQPTSRSKRFLGAIAIGLSAIDLLLGGLSYAHLNGQINKVEGKLNLFLEKQHDLNRQLLNIDGDIVEMISVLKSQTNQQIKQLNCQMIESTGTLLAAQLIRDWRDKLRILFAPTLTGKITQDLTPEIIEPIYLKDMLAHHHLLKASYFSKNLYNMYKVSKITIASTALDEKRTALTVHQILSFPLADEKTLLPFYHVTQTGIRKNSLCYTLDLPQYLYINENRFYEIDGINCDLTRTLATCYMPLLKHDMHNTCLRSFDKCRTIQTTCVTHYKYDSSGILVATTKNITAFHNTSPQGERSIKHVPTNTVGTVFLPWKEVDYIQVGNLFIEQPNVVSEALQFSFDERLLKRWYDILNTTALKTARLNTTKILDEIEQARAPRPDKQSKQVPIYVLIAITTLALSGLPIYLIYSKFAQNSACTATQKSTPLELPLSTIQPQAQTNQSSPLMQESLSVNIIPN